MESDPTATPGGGNGPDTPSRKRFTLKFQTWESVPKEQGSDTKKKRVCCWEPFSGLILSYLFES